MCDLQLCSAHFGVIQQNDFPFFFIELLKKKNEEENPLFIYSKGLVCLCALRIVHWAIIHCQFIKMSFAFSFLSIMLFASRITLTNRHKTLSLSLSFVFVHFISHLCLAGFFHKWNWWIRFVFYDRFLIYSERKTHSCINAHFNHLINTIIIMTLYLLHGDSCLLFQNVFCSIPYHHLHSLAFIWCSSASIWTL